MSVTALLQAFTETLQGLTVFTVNNCKAKHTSRVDTVSGDLSAIVSVSQHIRQNPDADNLHFEEAFGVKVTLTKRIKTIPHNKVGDEVYMKASTGLLAIARRVQVYMTAKKHTVRRLAQTKMEAETDSEIDTLITSECFITPLEWIRSDETPTIENEPWMHGEHSRVPRDLKDGPLALVLDVEFGKMTKVTVFNAEVC
jgi:hypothetical protein